MSRIAIPLRATRPPATHALPKPTAIRPQQFDVVLFGDNYLRWAPELAGDPMWTSLPQISSVTHRADDWRPRSPAGFTDTHRLVLPLHERNIFTTPRSSWVLVPSLQALLTFADKQRFSDFAAARGLQAFAPLTYAPGSEVFPLVLKRTNLTGTDGVVLVRSSAELSQRLGETPWLGRPVVLQEYVESTVDHVTHAVCVEGRMV